MSSDLDARFKKAVWLIRNGPPRPGTTNDTKLAYYAHFKQATEGDVRGDQPWAVQFEARAKYDAWAKLKGMSGDEAKAKYIALLEEGELDAARARRCARVGQGCWVSYFRASVLCGPAASSRSLPLLPHDTLHQRCPNSHEQGMLHGRTTSPSRTTQIRDRVHHHAQLPITA